MRAFTDPIADHDVDVEVRAWAASGAMALTGRVDGPPLGPPAGLVTRLWALGEAVEEAAQQLGGAMEVAPLARLGERAAIAGLHRRGTTSVGGATRLLPDGRDGWVAVSLARPDDVALVPAWLEVDVDGDPWPVVERVVSEREAADVVARARLLGLPVARLGEVPRKARPPVVASVLGSTTATASLAGVTVVELASLWAGPLCGSLLGQAGADVVKVESAARPDGSRRGPPAFFDRLNAGKRSVVVDLDSPAGVAELVEAIRGADVVIEGSRPRALEHLGIDAASMVAEGGPRAWVSLTGHGRSTPARDRVAFGDDAAVAGGLVSRDGDGPVFCADAVADPISGVVAAGAVLEALGTDERVLLDVALSAVAAAVAGPTLPVPRELEVAAPGAPPGVSGGWGR